MLGGGGLISANEYRCAHGTHINLGDLTPYYPITKAYIQRLILEIESIESFPYFNPVPFVKLCFKMYLTLTAALI
jgi:hypothetical protein